MDEDLRRRARDLAHAGAEERIRVAERLERAGQVVEALEVLVPAVEDAAVRSAIARYPVWNHVERSAGETDAYFAGPGLAGDARELWRVQVFPRPRRGVRSGVELSSSPLGLVCRLHERIVVLEPTTGAVRYQFEDALGGARGQIARDRVHVFGGLGLRSFDLWTGREVHRTDDIFGGMITADGRRLIRSVWVPGMGERCTVEIVSLGEDGALLERVRTKWEGRMLHAFVVARDSVFGFTFDGDVWPSDEANVSAFDMVTGETRWSHPVRSGGTGRNLAADDRGVAVQGWTPGSIALLDLDGQLTLSVDAGPGRLVALTPSHVLSVGPDPGKLSAWSRETGRLVWQFVEGEWLDPVIPTADVVYAWSALGESVLR